VTFSLIFNISNSGDVRLEAKLPEKEMVILTKILICDLGSVFFFSLKRRVLSKDPFQIGAGNR
jgi:hypothetical protein